MNSTFTESSIIRVVALLFATLGLLTASCAREAPSPQEIDSSCNSVRAKILEAVLNDAPLRIYAKHYFAAGTGLTVVSDAGRQIDERCRAKELSFSVITSAGLNDQNRDRYLLVTKLYQDGDAAFVEVLLHPTGKHGGFLLRKRNQWEVRQRELWETRSSYAP